MKPRGYMTNSPCVAEALAVRCQGSGGLCSRPKGGRHVLCSGVHAKDAAKYPRGLCRAILSGTAKQLRKDALFIDGCFGIQVPDDDAAVEAATRGLAQGYSEKFKDDLTSQGLKDSLVAEARANELSFFHSKGVWATRPRSMARAKTGRPQSRSDGWTSTRGMTSIPTIAQDSSPAS